MSIELLWWEGGEALEYLCTGDVTGGELLARNREAVRDPRFGDLRFQLCDMEAVTSFEITREEIRQIVDVDLRASQVAPDLERVAIACHEDLIFGFARMYEMTLDGRVPGWEVGVRRTRQEALEWLGIEDRERGTP